MKESLEKIKSFFSKQLNIYKCVVAVLSLALIFCIVSLIRMYINGGHSFNEPLDNGAATTAVGRFRDNIFTNKRSLGVWYDTAAIRNYLDVVYPALVKAEIDSINLYQQNNPQDPSHIDLNDYGWKVGFYWMKIEDPKDKKTKFDFCVVPMLVKNDQKAACDYFDLEEYPFYAHHVKIKVKRYANGRLALVDGDDTNGSAFDTGTMFP